MTAIKLKKETISEPKPCPEMAPEEKIGVTERERQWSAKKPPRPRVPRYVFIGTALFLALAFTVGGTYYYRRNILPEKYYMRAEGYFNAGNYEKAYEFFSRTAKIRAERRDVRNYMARSLAALGDGEGALANYELHIQTQPGDTEARLEAAQLYLEKKDYEKALGQLEAAWRKHGRTEARGKYADVALLAGKKEEAAAALWEEATVCGDPERVAVLAKKLMTLGRYGKALDAYQRFARLAPEDKRGRHGTAAAKAMLGLPADPAMTIIPGVSLGGVKLGMDKDEVKSLMGAPEKKIFTERNRVGVETWSYGAREKKESMKISFVSGRAREIETRYKGFKTETGVGAGNFLLEKYGGEIAGRVKLGDGRTRFDAAGGGMTFYAAGINEAGNGAEFVKLIVHRKGEKPLEEAPSSWIKNLMGK